MSMPPLPPLHPAGYPFILIAAFGAFLLSYAGSEAFFLGVILTGWVMYFFRDPARVTPTEEGLLVSPADGLVIAIKRDVVPEKVLGLGEEKRTRISIFLNVFDVHINRIPITGKITNVDYRKGKFVNASLDKASEDNERNAIAIDIEGDHPFNGHKVGVVQIAGLIARRIMCFVAESQHVKTGQRFGLIRFGSRTDVYLPVGMEPLVCVGQRVLGGETIIADCVGSQKQMEGEVR
ncbi:MAG: phosphatidylserine decarboxylase [Bdellovibrionales bacterium]